MQSMIIWLSNRILMLSDIDFFDRIWYNVSKLGGETMPGKLGYVHRNCGSENTELVPYKIPIKNYGGFTETEKNLIWDFYVSRSLSGSAGTMSVDLNSCGWDTSKEYDVILSELARNAGFGEDSNSFCFVRATTIKDTLSAMNLDGSCICIEHPRNVIHQKCKPIIDEAEKLTIRNDETQLTCLFRHIRNSFAHSNTYFFNNGMLLLEDKDGTKISARILIRQETLFEWMRILNRNGAHPSLI